MKRLPKIRKLILPSDSKKKRKRKKVEEEEEEFCENARPIELPDISLERDIREREDFATFEPEPATSTTCVSLSWINEFLCEVEPNVSWQRECLSPNPSGICKMKEIFGRPWREFLPPEVGSKVMAFKDAKYLPPLQHPCFVCSIMFCAEKHLLFKAKGGQSFIVNEWCVETNKMGEFRSDTCFTGNRIWGHLPIVANVTSWIRKECHHVGEASGKPIFGLEVPGELVFR